MAERRKWQTDLSAGDRFEFTGLTNENLGDETRIITVTGISVAGNVQYRIEMFAPGNDRIGNRTADSAPLLTVLEMIEQGIWRHQA